MGAAPLMATSSWSSPSDLRNGANAPSSRACQVACSSSLASSQASLSAIGLADLDRTVELLCARRVGGHRAGHTGLELLPDARDAEHDVRPHLADICGHQARLGTAADLVTEGGLHVVAGHAFGDVRHRQVGHQPLPQVLGQAERELQALDRPADVVVADHHALGRPGRPRRVDDRGQIVRRTDRCGLLEIGRLRWT